MVGVEEECGEGDEDQWEEVPFGSHHWLGFQSQKMHSIEVRVFEI